MGQVSLGADAVFLGALVAGVVVSSVTAVIAHRYGEGDPTTRALFWMTVFAAIWGLFTAAEQVVASHQLEVLFSKLTYIGITGSTAATLLFAVLYSGRERYVTRRTIGLLAIEPIFANVMVWTTESHGLWYGVVDGRVDLSVHGEAFLVHVIYSYFLSIIFVALLVEVIRRQQSLFQRQSVALAIASTAPVVANVVSLTYFQVDVTPVAFSVSGAALLWAILRADLTTLSPIARERIVDDMNAGALVLNQRDVVVDLNQTMRGILDIDPDEAVVGSGIDEVLEAYESISEHFQSKVQSTGEIAFDTTEGVEYYSVDVSPLHDHREKQIGRLFLVHDITEQKRRERELERKNEQLDQFASLVSHDLRNPLNVAHGVLDLAEESGDPEHFEEVRDMHERMQDLIDDVLTLAREGDSVDETTTVDLGNVVAEAWANVDTGGATLANDCGSIAVTADRNRLLQVFENLFRNSVEHAAIDGDPVHVEVGAMAPDGAVDPNERGFYVADDGTGIPAGNRDAVLDHGYTTTEDGTGLGLSIVEQIVRAHGWELDVTESDSGGARFEVRRVASLARNPEVSEPPTTD
jgi:signal transduction histidine kinase